MGAIYLQPRRLVYSMNPTFSIITPSFRQLDWLKLCAASIADQEEVTLEHIVQDAGSGPELEAWAKNQPGMTLYVEKDKGMYDAVNRGLRRSTGEILAYLNCDEQYLPGTLKAVADFFDANPEIDIVYGNVIVVGNNGEYLCSRPVVLPEYYHTWVSTLGVFTAATFFRRRLLDEHGFFFKDEWRDVGDAAWTLDVLRKKLKAAVLARYLSVFADTGENMNCKPNAIDEGIRMRQLAPWWAQKLAPFWVLRFRLRRLFSGVYRLQPFTYQIYTDKTPEERSEIQVQRPTFIWRGRFGPRKAAPPLK